MTTTRSPGAFVYRGAAGCQVLGGRASSARRLREGEGVLKSAGIKCRARLKQARTSCETVRRLGEQHARWSSLQLKFGDAIQGAGQARPASAQDKGVTDVYHHTRRRRLVSGEAHAVVFAIGGEGTTTFRRAQGLKETPALRHRRGGRQPRLLGHERLRPRRRGDHLHARPVLPCLRSARRRSVAAAALGGAAV